MKFLFLSAAIFFLSSKKMIAKNQDPKIHFELIQTGYAVAPLNWVGLPADTVFCFALLLTNKSKNNIKFGHLTCGWIDHFEPTSKDFEQLGLYCSANYPTTTTLKSSQTCLNYLFLRRKNKSNHLIQMVFNYIEGNSYDKFMLEEAIGSDKFKQRTILVQSYIKSNPCKIQISNKIDFFELLSFRGPNKLPYYWVGFNIQDNNSRHFNDFKRYFYS